jgi:hypothetical protein
MKTVQLEDHHPEYVMAILDSRWRMLDKKKSRLYDNEAAYRDALSEMQRIEVIQERMRNAE